MAELVVSDLTMEFATSGYVIRPLNNLSFTADDGGLVVLLGPSGCGKTTLLLCVWPGCSLPPRVRSPWTASRSPDSPDRISPTSGATPSASSPGLQPDSEPHCQGKRHGPDEDRPHLTG